MPKIKLLMLVGSFRIPSFNRPLAEMIASCLGQRCEVRFLEYDNLDFMKGKFPDPLPVSFIRIRKEMVNTDALWILKPEYETEVPVALKNLLNWLAHPIEIGASWGNRTVIRGKPVTFTGVGAEDEVKRFYKDLREVLDEREALVMDSRVATIDPGNVVASTDDGGFLLQRRPLLAAQADEFVGFIEKNVPVETLGGAGKVV